jgi:pyruvate formate lyase activating enzyme
VITGFNSSDQELTRLAEFLVSVSPNILWHVTAFHEDYKMADPDDTGPENVARAAQIGRKAGLCYIYAGDLPGEVDDLENTNCPNCQELLVERFGYRIGQLSPDFGWPLPDVRHIDPRAMGPSFPRTDH